MRKFSLFLLLCIAFSLAPAQARDARDFSLPDLDGRVHSLSDYRGKWVLVNYWATWCPPCLEELPELEIFHTNSDGKAVVLGVNHEAIDKEELKAFVDDQFLSFPILVAGQRPKRSQLIAPVKAMPTSYLVSPEGKLVARQEGAITAKMIRSFITKLESK